MPERTATIAQIKINDRQPVATPAGQSLLAALNAQHIFVPSACGGHGICGLCRVKVLAGAGPFSAREENILSKEDRAAGIRLACQVPVLNDLRIEIPNDYFTARAYTAKVVGLRDLTHDIREFTLQLQAPPSIDFKAGQYIQLRIPPYEQSRKIVYRAYSIASPPSAGDRLELEIRQVLNGVGTTYIFKHLALNMTVVFNGPYGDFYLRDNERSVILIAGGSGMAPMKAILSDMQARKIRRPVRYFFGTGARRDLFLLDEMQALEQSLPNFKFIPALAKPLPEDQWTGETGLITTVLDRHLENPYSGEAYLCGSPAMIQAAITILHQKGVADDRIFFDNFA